MMIIELNTDLVTREPRNLDASFFNQRLANTIGKDYTFLFSGDETGDFQFGFLELVSNAYSRHEKISINPQDIWYIILTEIAAQIKKRPDQFRSLYTSSSDKIDILVPTSDPMKIDLGLVIDQLKDLVPSDISVYFPELSTATPGSAMAFNAAFCDGLQVYYNYMTYCCGIPAIKVNGTKEDWIKIAKSAEQLMETFGRLKMLDMMSYMRKVSIALFSIAETTFHTPDPDFWQGIFTSKNVGSGGELVISGWITDFYYEVCKLPKLENFSKSISIVPYKNVETGSKFAGVHGAFKRIVDDAGFVGCDYMEIIFKDNR